MTRTLFGPGARGDIVRRLQLALRDAQPCSLDADGIFGQQTAAALCSFQQARQLPSTGLLDLDTCSLLAPGLLPSLEERCLQLTAAIEEHGYMVAIGNSDGAWLTWGIIGFTLKFGQVQRILAAVADDAPALIPGAFGALAPELLATMRSPAAAQRRWAESISTPGGDLLPAWRDAFARFGEMPLVQQEQRRLAHDHYFVPALASARELGLRTELGVALCFDIHVQNGGIKPRARALLRDGLAATPPAGERDLRCALAHAIAETALPRFRDDVRARKLAIATGAGTVHGLQLVLENWGLAEISAPELAQPPARAAAHA
jgi:peptidoglycan hydrolase-like protein with peptidoglycan-binding domain